MSDTELSRRSFLKRGAVLGGAVAWATPVIQAVGMRPAMAAGPSGPCDVTYAAKIESPTSTGCPTDSVPIGDGCCVDIVGQPAGGAMCLTVPSTVNDGCGRIDDVEIVSGLNWVITLSDGCRFENGPISLKSGNDPCEPPASAVWDETAGTLMVTKASGGDISHVEFFFCCGS